MKIVTIKLISTSILLMMCTIPLLTAAQTDIQERNVGSFSGIHQTTSADVFISKGNTVSVNVKADADKIDKITTEVVDGVLNIGSKNYLGNVRTLEVYITMPTLDLIKNSGSGDILIKGDVPGNDVLLQISGSGDLEAELAATNCKLMISGSGDIELEGVRGDLSVKISGSGDVEAGELSLNDCEVEIFGSGDTKLKGKAARLNTKLSGSGDFNGYGLTAASVNIKSNGSGDMVVNAAEKISAILNGSGDLTYYGSPEYVDVESNGSGEVYRK